MRWKSAWKQNWAAGTLRNVLPLFAADATLRSVPHREGDVGHEAIGVVFDTVESAARDVRCPLVAGNRAVLAWWCSWHEEGSGMSMAGVTTFWFDGAGLVTESRDYWNILDGASEPYEGWYRDR